MNRLQGEWFALPAAPPLALELSGYDVILVNITGGKDSQAALDETVRAADAAGVRDRIVTVFYFPVKSPCRPEEHRPRRPWTGSP